MAERVPIAVTVDAQTRRDRAIDALATLAWLADLSHEDVPASRLVALIDILTAELHAASIALDG